MIGGGGAVRRCQVSGEVVPVDHRTTAGVCQVSGEMVPVASSDGLICANNTDIHVEFISYFESVLFPCREVSFHVIT